MVWVGERRAVGGVPVKGIFVVYIRPNRDNYMQTDVYTTSSYDNVSVCNRLEGYVVGKKRKRKTKC